MIQLETGPNNLFGGVLDEPIQKNMGMISTDVRNGVVVRVGMRKT